MKEKKIPIKNYILVVILFVCSIGLGLYLINLYNNNRNYKNDGNKTMSFLSEVSVDSLDSYIIDNHEAIIYISSSNDTKVVAYENKLKDLILEENLEKSILYLDASDLDSSFYDNFEKKYQNSGTSLDLEQANPNIIIIVDGKITKVLYNGYHELDIDKTRTFIKENIGD